MACQDHCCRCGEEAVPPPPAPTSAPPPNPYPHPRTTAQRILSRANTLAQYRHLIAVTKYSIYQQQGAVVRYHSLSEMPGICLGKKMEYEDARGMCWGRLKEMEEKLMDAERKVKRKEEVFREFGGLVERTFGRVCEIHGVEEESEEDQVVERTIAGKKNEEGRITDKEAKKNRAVEKREVVRDVPIFIKRMMSFEKKQEAKGRQYNAKGKLSGKTVDELMAALGKAQISKLMAAMHDHDDFGSLTTWPEPPGYASLCELDDATFEELLTDVEDNSHWIMPCMLMHLQETGADRGRITMSMDGTALVAAYLKHREAINDAKAVCRRDGTVEAEWILEELIKRAMVDMQKTFMEVVDANDTTPRGEGDGEEEEVRPGFSGRTDKEIVATLSKEQIARLCNAMNQPSSTCADCVKLGSPFDPKATTDAPSLRALDDKLFEELLAEVQADDSWTRHVVMEHLGDERGRGGVVHVKCSAQVTVYFKHRAAVNKARVVYQQIQTEEAKKTLDRLIKVAQQELRQTAFVHVKHEGEISAPEKDVEPVDHFPKPTKLIKENATGPGRGLTVDDMHLLDGLMAAVTSCKEKKIDGSFTHKGVTYNLGEAIELMSDTMSGGLDGLLDWIDNGGIQELTRMVFGSSTRADGVGTGAVNNNDSSDTDSDEGAKPKKKKEKKKTRKKKKKKWPNKKSAEAECPWIAREMLQAGQLDEFGQQLVSTVLDQRTEHLDEEGKAATGRLLDTWMASSGFKSNVTSILDSSIEDFDSTSLPMRFRKRFENLSLVDKTFFLSWMVNMFTQLSYVQQEHDGALRPVAAVMDGLKYQMNLDLAENVSEDEPLLRLMTDFHKSTFDDWRPGELKMFSAALAQRYRRIVEQLTARRLIAMTSDSVETEQTQHLTNEEKSLCIKYMARVWAELNKLQPKHKHVTADNMARLTKEVEDNLLTMKRGTYSSIGSSLMNACTSEADDGLVPSAEEEGISPYERFMVILTENGQHKDEHNQEIEEGLQRAINIANLGPEKYDYSAGQPLHLHEVANLFGIDLDHDAENRAVEALHSRLKDCYPEYRDNKAAEAEENRALRKTTKKKHVSKRDKAKESDENIEQTSNTPNRKPPTAEERTASIDYINAEASRRSQSAQKQCTTRAQSPADSVVPTQAHAYVSSPTTRDRGSLTDTVAQWQQQIITEAQTKLAKQQEKKFKAPPQAALGPSAQLPSVSATLEQAITAKKTAATAGTKVTNIVRKVDAVYGYDGGNGGWRCETSGNQLGDSPL